MEFNNYVTILALKIIKTNIATILFAKMAGEFDSKQHILHIST